MTEGHSQREFLEDMWLRSLGDHGWFQRFGPAPGLGFQSWSPGQQDYLVSVHDQICRMFQTTAQLQDGANRYPVETVSYDRREGWKLSAAGAQAYLGKVVASEGTPLTVGRQTYFSGHGTVRGQAPLSIGSFTSIAEGVYANTSPDAHPMAYPAMVNFQSERRCRQDGYALDLQLRHTENAPRGISIGNDAWLGRDVRLFHGAEIADGCVVAERSLVKGKTEPYGIYAGTPARLKKFRFREQTIAELLEAKWWDWPQDRIQRNRAFFATSLPDFDGSLFDLIAD